MKQMRIIDRDFIDEIKPTQELYKWFIQNFKGKAEIGEFLDALKRENSKWYEFMVQKLISIDLLQKHT